MIVLCFNKTFEPTAECFENNFSFVRKDAQLLQSRYSSAVPTSIIIKTAHSKSAVQQSCVFTRFERYDAFCMYIHYTYMAVNSRFPFKIRQV